MLATSKAAVKPKIVLLGQNDPAKQIELDPEEGPFESWLAVTQDMWGVGNLTPLDNIFASTAIGALALTDKGIFGAVCYHLGDRLFCYSREIGAWIDVFECEPAVSQVQKRPKDKVKLHLWNANEHRLGKNRFTKLAVLYASKLSGSYTDLSRDCANSLKPGGNLFFADLVAGKDKAGASLPTRFGKMELQSLEDHKGVLSQAGLTLCNAYDLTGDVAAAIRRGLYNSINMLANIRTLKEPWRGQRLAAYFRELETLSRLYCSLENGDVAAAGILALKP
jgi:hypothetical protein